MKGIYVVLFSMITYCLAYAQNDVNQKVLSAEKDIDSMTKFGRVLIDRFQTDNRQKYGSFNFLEFDIRAMKDTQSDSLVLNIECIGDALGNDWIRVMPEDMDVFLQSMNTILEKYIEWSDVAKTNNITNFRKDIPLQVKPRVYDAFIHTDAKRENYYLRTLEASFFVDEDGKPSVSIGIRKRGSSFDTKLYFTSVDKLEHLVYLIQPSYVSSVYENTQKRIKELEEATQSRDALFN